jgi:hypothetical protein
MIRVDSGYTLILRLNGKVVVIAGGSNGMGLVAVKRVPASAAGSYRPAQGDGVSYSVPLLRSLR